MVTLPITLPKEGLRIGLISDTHLHIWRKHNKFFSHIEDAFNVFYDECKKRKVNLIVHCGDLFHAKEIVTAEGLLRTNKLIAKLSTLCPIVIITGNHDIVAKDNSEFNLINNYVHFNNVYVVAEPTIINYSTPLYLVPYYRNIVDVLSSIKFKKDSFFFGHFGVRTFDIHSNEYINNTIGDVNPTSLSQFKQCFLGHYHGYQQKENICYVSAPFQSVYGDEHYPHGFVFCDVDSNTHEFVSNEHTPRFITVEFKKTELQKLLGVKQHYIRLMLTKKVSAEQLVKIRYKLMENNYEVKIVSQINTDVKIATCKDWSKIAFETTENLLQNVLTTMEEQKQLPEGYSKEYLLGVLGV